MEEYLPIILQVIGGITLTSVAIVGICFAISWVDMLVWKVKRRRQLAEIVRDHAEIWGDAWKEPKL